MYFFGVCIFNKFFCSVLIDCYVTKSQYESFSQLNQSIIKGFTCVFNDKLQSLCAYNDLTLKIHKDAVK